MPFLSEAQGLMSGGTIYTGATGITVGTPVYLSAADTIAVADGTVNNKTPAIGLVAQVVTATTYLVQYDGEFSGLSGLTAGSAYYVGAAGALVTSTAGLVVINLIGVAKDTTTLILRTNTGSSSSGIASFSSLALSGLLYESYASGIIAGTTRTQIGATAMTKEVNRVDTSTAPGAGSTLGDGVALPVSAAGLDITVINNTANPIQVYPSTADTGATINGIAAATGLPLPPGDVAHFECAAATDWRMDPGFGASGALPIMLSAESVPAVNPVSQATATALAAVINHVTTVNAAGAAVALPAAKYGLEIAVENSTANALTVYPVNAGTDTINGLAANAPIVLPGFSTALFRAASAGTWQSDPFFNGAGAIPSTNGAQPGSATTGVARAGGNLSVQVSSAGLGNGADATDDVLFTYALPASALDVAGRQITITAGGKFAANANNKRIKIWWGTTTQTVGSAVAGGTLIADSGVVTTNGGGWEASVMVTKYGAAGSNTQLGSNAQIAAGASHLGTSAPVLLTATESGVINITVTGASPTSSAASDVLGQIFDVAFNN